MRRLVLLYNPSSSRFLRVEKEVLAPLRQVSGLMICKVEVKKTNIEENIQRLAKILMDDDLLVVAGGDGTASIGLNAAIISRKKVQFSALPYGNFNDMARTLGAKNILATINTKHCRKFYPLEIRVNGKIWRYAGCYMTAGMFAESTEVFDEKKVRKNLKKNNNNLIFSVLTLAKWYFKNHKKHLFLPEFRLNGKKVKKQTTDYLAINGKSVAKVMRGGKYFENQQKFLSNTARLGSFSRLMAFMVKSIIRGIGGKTTANDVLEFAEPANIELQIEGEYQHFRQVFKIEVEKSAHFVLY